MTHDIFLFHLLQPRFVFHLGHWPKFWVGVLGGWLCLRLFVPGDRWPWCPMFVQCSTLPPPSCCCCCSAVSAPFSHVLTQLSVLESPGLLPYTCYACFVGLLFTCPFPLACCYMLCRFCGHPCFVCAWFNFTCLSGCDCPCSMYHITWDWQLDIHRNYFKPHGVPSQSFSYSVLNSASIRFRLCLCLDFSWNCDVFFISLYCTHSWTIILLFLCFSLFYHDKIW